MYEDILPQDVAAWRERGAQVVDVREPWEFAAGHVPGSTNIPLSEFVARLDELRAPLVLVCASGSRSASAAAYLDRSGFGEVANLDGGVHLWEEVGLELER
jgi:rhodanese-related sulfurtransferase